MADYSDIPEGFRVANDAQSYSDIPQGFAVKAPFVGPTQDMVKRPSLMDYIKGAGEAGLSIGTGMITEPINQLYAAGVDALRDGKPGEQTGNDYLRTTPLQPYQPRGEVGQSILKTIGGYTAPIGDFINKVTDVNNPNPTVIANTPGADPAAATQATGHLMQGLVGLLPGKAFKVTREVGPTEDALRASAKAGYKAAETSGELAPQAAMGDLVRSVEQKLTDTGFDADANPMTAKALNKLYQEATRPDADFHSMKGLDQVRKTLRNYEDTAGVDPLGNPTPDAMRAGHVLDEFDDWLDKVAPSAGKDFAQGASDWRKLRNVETIQSVIDKAKLNAESTTYENALRIQFKNLAQNPRRMARFNEAEQSAIESAATGDFTQHALRAIAKLAPDKFFPAIFEASAVVTGAHPLLGLGAAGAGLGAAALARTRRLAMAQNALSAAALGRLPTTTYGIRGVNAAAALPPAANSLYRYGDEDQQNALSR